MRWRTAKKKGRQEVASSPSSSFVIAPLRKRLKAFVIDSFMLLMPILYLVFYLVFGSREGFSNHMLTGWLYVIIPYGIVTSLFFNVTGQTPGYKAYDIVLHDFKSGEKPSLGIIGLRFLLFILTCATLFGLILPFLRKDRLGVYDIISHSGPIEK